MAVRPVVLVLTCVAALLPLGSPAAAAQPVCPTSWQQVSPFHLLGQLSPAQSASIAAAGGIAALFAEHDLNRNGHLCQLVGSLGRAPGRPVHHAVYKDDRPR